MFVFLVVFAGALTVGFIAVAEPAHVLHFIGVITAIILVILLIGGAATQVNQTTQPGQLPSVPATPEYSEHTGYSAAIAKIADPYLGRWGDLAILGGLAVGAAGGFIQKSQEQAHTS